MLPVRLKESLVACYIMAGQFMMQLTLYLFLRFGWCTLGTVFQHAGSAKGFLMGMESVYCRKQKSVSPRLSPTRCAAAPPAVFTPGLGSDVTSGEAEKNNASFKDLRSLAFTSPWGLVPHEHYILWFVFWILFLAHLFSRCLSSNI